MVALEVGTTSLTVRLSAWESGLALHRSFDVPLHAVRDVARAEDAWTALRGIRAPGTGWPGLIAYGTFRHSGLRDFAAVWKHRPAVVVDLDPTGASYARIIATVADPEMDVAAIRRATSG